MGGVIPVDVSPLEFRCLIGAFFERYSSALFLRSLLTTLHIGFLVRRHAVLIAESSAMYRSAGDFT